MLETIIITELIAFIAIFYRLVTTNHWSTGKKLLVLLTGSIIIKDIGLFIALSAPFSILAIATSVPILIVGVIMCAMFYGNDFVH